MLTWLTEAEFDRYVDWAYGLALDLTRSGYPTYADGIKTRENFISRARNGMARENEEVLLHRVGGDVCGWIHWFWLAEDGYAHTCSFLTASHAEEAMSEFVAYAAERRPGYALHLGFPTDNACAVRCLDAQGFRLIEESVNHTLFFDAYTPEETTSAVARMSGSEDEAAFRAVHTETDMYWTADRILADISHWQVYLYREGDRPQAALFAHVDADGWPEIFGIVGADSPEAYQALMAACLNDCKAAGCAHMTYFEDDERRLPVLAGLGFQVVSRYVCYQRIL